MQEIRHGALFSGSGGFELAARMCGIKSVWASEIEPFPIRVTRAQFPEMEHIGDIGMAKGASLVPVDIISGGSPCQDMSIAGRRRGLKGERSVLFMDYIRIVKEMREKHGKPRFMVWENVPGAFSSNKGEDFRCVLEEIAGIAEPGVSVPGPPKGKWRKSGEIVGDGYSIAWRVLDAQYWGVPQRRRRIFLVADFGSECAGKILFERGGLSRNFTEGRKETQDIASAPEAGIGASGRTGGRFALSIDNHPQDSRVGISQDGKTQTLTGNMGTGGGNVPMVIEGEAVGFHITQDPVSFTEKTPCLSTGNPVTGQSCIGVAEIRKCYGIGSQASNAMNSPNPHSGIYEADTSRTLDCGGGDPTCNQGGIVVVDGVYCLQGNMIGREDGNGPQGGGVNREVSFTLNTMDHHAVAFAMQSYSQYKESEKGGCLRGRDFNGPNDVVLVDAVARRFMPLECSRLQGFPDNWTDGLEDAEPSASEVSFWMRAWAEWWALVGRARGTKMPKDEKAVRRWLKSGPSESELYKMWGNGIALPCALYVFEGIALQINPGDSPEGKESFNQEQKGERCV